MQPDAQSGNAAYVAVRWPAPHVLMHHWGHMERVDREKVYDQLREQVMESIRDALAVMGIEVVEEVESDA